MAKTNHLPLIDMKPCKLLHRGHVPYPVIARTKRRPSGVYKVAYRWETVYVGSSSNIIKDLRKQFSGNGKQDLIEFLLNLTEEELEMVSVYWLDETIYVHNCGKSYVECITDLQGKKPKFNDIPPILCSISTASVAVVNTDSKTLKHEKGQSQDVSIRPSNATGAPKEVNRRRLSSLDKHTALEFSLMSRKRPAEEDRERSQFHTDSKKMKTGQHVEHRRLTKNPNDTPICRSETANVYFSTTVPNATMNLKMLNIETPEMSLSNIPRSPVMPKSSYKQRSQSVRGAPVNMSLNHENLTTHELPQQLCISPRSPEFEERIQYDTAGYIAGRTDIRKDISGNTPISTVCKENPPACPTTLQVDKNSQKKLQLQPAGDKCESPSEETFRHYSTAPQKHSQKTNPSFQASSEKSEQTHAVSSTQSLHTAIQPRHELRSPEKDPGKNERSDEKHKESTTCAPGGNHPERNMPPVSSTSPSGNSLAETLSVLTPHAVSEPETDTTRSCTGVPTGDNSKLLERILKAALAKPDSLGWSIKPSGSRNLETKNETTSSPNKNPGSNSVGMLVCEPIASSTQTCPSNQSSQAKVPNKASGEPRSQTNVPNKASGEPRSQTNVPNKASGEPRLQTNVPNIAPGWPRLQTNVPNIASGEPRSQTNVPNKASGEPRSQTNVPNKASGEPRSQTKVPNKASGEPRSQTNVPNIASGKPRSQTKVPNIASGEPRSQTNVPNIASGEPRSQTKVPNIASASGEPHSQTNVPNKASGEPRSQTNVPNIASGEPRSQTKVPNIASGEPRSQTNVPNIASGEPHSQTNVPNKASGEPRSQTNVPNKASGEPRSQTNVPNIASGEPRLQTKVPNKASGEPRLQTKVPNKASGEPRRQTKVPNKASGEPRSQTNVLNIASGEPRSQTKIPNIAFGEPRLQTKVPNKASRERLSQTKVPNKASGEQRLRTKVVNKASRERRSQTKVPNKASGERRLQTKVPNKASRERRSQTKVPNKASRERRSQTKVPNKASGERRLQTKVPNKASGEPRPQTKVPNKASGEPRSQTKVPNKASRERLSQTKVPNKASGERRLQTKVPNKASGEPCPQTKVPNKASGEPRTQTKVVNKASGEPRPQTIVPNIASGRPRTIRAQPLPKKDTGITQGPGVFSVIKTIGSKVFTMMNPFASNGGQ